MGVVIDTSVLIGIERRRLTLDYLSLDEPIALSAISVSEMLVGLTARTHRIDGI